ncbi:MAG: type II toxin-antitoxin system VapC family toxin [Thermoanaerobaculia bacterium]
MIGIDTNVLVRYIVHDDAADARVATKVIEHDCSADDPGYVSLVVLCELAWVLDRGYGYERAQIGQVIQGILSVTELEVESRDLAWEALRRFESHRADFADYVIGLVSKKAGAATTVTFDRRAADGDLFTLARKRNAE